METILLDRVQAAQVLGVSVATLARWHARGVGPASVKLGDHRQSPCRYAREDLENWLRSGCPMDRPARPVNAPKGRWSSDPRNRGRFARRQTAGSST